MNLEKYFFGLEKKYGKSGIIPEFKKDYFGILADPDISFERKKSLLKSIKTVVKANYEVRLIKKIYAIFLGGINAEEPDSTLKSTLQNLVNMLGNPEDFEGLDSDSKKP